MIVKEKLSLLKTHFGYDSFKPNQEEIIEEVLSGKDALAIMPTGGGKSICYQLPALALPGTTIVISPLIALMKDQVDALQANGIAAAFYNSSQEFQQREQILADLRQQKLDLFYLAPESLMQLLPVISEIRLNLIAIDEAHCISSWGHDFRPAYVQLGCLKSRFPEIPVLALTATADRATQDDIIKQLNIPDATKHIASFDRKNLFLEVRPGNNRNKQILNFLRSRRSESGIIYCLSRNGTERLATTLQDYGFKAKAYHAGMESAERSSIQEDFVNDRTLIIVATIAFGMGIDKSNVRWVIHYNIPKNIEGYYQEIGRSGRDGLPAHTLLFYSLSDTMKLRRFFIGTPTEEFQLAKLERMQQFAEALSCRRIALLSYFGEHISENCGNCDICKTPPKYFDGTLLAQKVCSAVARLKEQEALGMVLDVLRGAQNAAIYEKGYQHIKTFAAVKDVSWQDLHQYAIQLVNQGVLEIRFHENARLLLTPLARSILYENKTLQLATLVKAKKETKKQQSKRTKTISLFEKLQKLRSVIATEEKVPAYIVFSDASLQNMVEKMPASDEEFGSVSGVGKLKQIKYAIRFLNAIAVHRVSHLPTHEQTSVLFQKGMSPEEIANQRELKPETIHGHLLKAHHLGEPVNIGRLINAKETAAIKKARKSLKKPEGLKPYFDHFEEQWPYWKIKYGLYMLGERSFLSKS